jgi:hypothetical protein
VVSGEVGIGGTDATDHLNHLWCAADRHLDIRDGDRYCGLDSGDPKMLIAGGFVAAVSTLALAQEFVEWRSRTKGKVSEASLVQRQLLPPAA